MGLGSIFLSILRKETFSLSLLGWSCSRIVQPVTKEVQPDAEK